MRRGAGTPEELEMLFEDAFVLRDRGQLTQLFEDGAVLAVRGGRYEAHGGREIARLATDMWLHGLSYLADPRRVLQARDTALVVSERSTGVARRGGDGAWRYAISLLSSQLDPQEER
jgi:hypothetical protein